MTGGQLNPMQRLLLVSFISGWCVLVALSCSAAGVSGLQLNDDIGPAIVVTSHASGDTYSNVMTIEGTITDLATESGEPGLVASAQFGLGFFQSASIDVEDDGSFSISLSTFGLIGTVPFVITAADWNENVTTFQLDLVPPRAIAAFSFLAAHNETLSEDVIGTLSGDEISVVLPTTADARSLVASFEIDGTSVSVGGIGQLSGVSVNDFVEPVQYIVGANDGSSTIYTVNVSGFIVGASHEIAVDVDGAVTVHVADIDGDGHPDVIAGGDEEGAVVWYRNDGSGGFSERRVISDIRPGVRSVFAAQINPATDGHIDVLSASNQDDTIAWYSNTNGDGSSWSQSIITSSADAALSVSAARITDDDNLDVLAVSTNDNGVRWFRNDGLGVFDLFGGGSPGVVTTEHLCPRWIHAAPLDGFPGPEVIVGSACDTEVKWYSHGGNPAGGFGAGNLVDSAMDARSIEAVDLNGDGELDLLVASPDLDMVAWYENTGGPTLFSSRNVIANDADAAVSAHAVDLDNDGDLDIVSASTNDDRIAWYENTDGLGTFVKGFDLSTTADGAGSVTAADLDGDGDFDVISASQFDDSIIWYENRLVD